MTEAQRIPTPPPMPPVVGRAEYDAEVERLRVREKAHTHEADALAAARRRLPAVEVDGGLALVGPDGPTTLLDTFEGRRQLIAYYFMWNPGGTAAEQCEGCTHYTNQVTELAHLHSHDVTYAVFNQGAYDESRRYRDFMGWTMPWYSVEPSQETLLVGRQVGMMHLVCYLRDDEDRVYETYWTTVRGVEAMDYSYALMDLTVYGRQEPHENSPEGWPQSWGHAGAGRNVRTDGRPVSQWSRLEAGRADDLGGGS